jgi:hypothetical protein
MVNNPVWDICEHVARSRCYSTIILPAILGRGRGCEGASGLERGGLPRATFDVGYFPTNTPPWPGTPASR